MSGLRIAVTRPLPLSARDLSASAGAVAESPFPDRPLSHAELVDHVRGSNAVVSMLYDRIDEAVLTSAGPQLQVVANVAVGYENVELPAAARHRVAVTNTPGVLPLPLRT